MNRHSKYGIAALVLSVVLAACPLTACSGEGSMETSNSAENSAEQSSSIPSDESTANDPANSTSSGGSNGESSGESPEDPQSSAGENSQGGAESGASSNESSTGGDQPQGGNSSSAAGNDRPQGGESSAASEEPEDPNEKINYIYLEGSSAKCSGTGVQINGSVIKIVAGGSYEISGKLDNGQILVDTSADKKKVKLRLNNCDITNSNGAAISCLAAKKLTIKSLAGTTSNFKDGGDHSDDKGAIFSEDTINFTGEGVINIKGVYAHGVQSDDDITVNGGTINITATKSCLHSNDGIEINGGTLFCDGGTNGIKTDGYITISGGSSIFLGGTREEKGAIYCDGVFSVTGGTFWAIGNTITAPRAATTTANVIGVNFSSQQNGNTLVRVENGSNTVFTLTSPRVFKSVLYASPQLKANASYTVSYGGSVSGGATKNYVTSGGSWSGGTDGGSFTASSKITMHSIA